MLSAGPSTAAESGAWIHDAVVTTCLIFVCRSKPECLQSLAQGLVLVRGGAAHRIYAEKTSRARNSGKIRFSSLSRRPRHAQTHGHSQEGTLLWVGGAHRRYSNYYMNRLCPPSLSLIWNLYCRSHCIHTDQYIPPEMNQAARQVSHVRRLPQ